MQENNRKFLRAAIALLMILSVLFSLTACSFGKGTVPAASVTTVTGEITERQSKPANKTLHLIDAENLGVPRASSGLMQIFLDDNSYGIALYEKTKEKFWYSMPTTPNDSYDYSAATVTLDVLYGNTMYKLNSQDDSVAYRNTVYEALGGKKENGFKITYVLCADAQTAKKVSTDQISSGTLTAKNFMRTDIAFEVAISYELIDGNLYVSATWKNLSENPNAVVVNLSLLPFFGASDGGEKGDYILVPDGPGAQIHTAVNDPSFKPLDLRVYGDNPSAKDGTEVHRALFPAFGAKQGENAYAVIIEQGDAIATIHAERSNGAHGYNTVGTSFCITEHQTTETNGKTITQISNNSYQGDIKLCVRLLGGANAELNGLAAACREQFMRTGYLSTDIVSNEEYLPFSLNILGTYNTKPKLLPFVTMERTLTTFEQAQDMLARMKAKGINNVDIRFKGAVRGGTNPTRPGSLKLSFGLGGKKGLTELYDYSQAQGHSLFVDLPLVSYAAGGVRTESALSIESEDAHYSAKSDLSGIMESSSFTRKLIRWNTLEQTEIHLLTEAQKLSLDGFCVSDVSSLLYSDYSTGYTNRVEAMTLVRENLPALSTNRPFMVDTGNFYAIQHAELVSNLPQNTGAQERRGVYTAVPFVQMILHGTVDYSGKAINLSENRTTAMLRSVEYGATPCYTWCFDDSAGDVLCFAEQLNEAVDFYQRANEVLSDLRGTRIVDNGSADTPGVRFTQYDNGAIIYVNYNDTEATLGKIHIEPNSFFRIG